MFTNCLISIDFTEVVAKQTHIKLVYYTRYCGKNATMLLGYNNIVYNDYKLVITAYYRKFINNNLLLSL